MMIRTLVALAAALLPGAGLTEPLRLGSRTIQPTPENRISLVDLMEAIPPGEAGTHILVQLDHIPALEERRGLADRGLVLHEHVPTLGYTAWLARGAERDPEVAAAAVWSGLLSAADRTHALLRSGTAPSFAIAPDGRLQLVAYAFPGVPAQDFRAALVSAGAQVVRVLPEHDRWEIQLPAARVTELAGLDPVRWVRPASPPAVDDLDGLRPSHGIDAAQIAPYSLSGAGVEIGQVETGNPDDSHDDLSGRVVKLVTGSTTAHATHVAGIAVGDGTLSAAHGGTPMEWRGVAPAAAIFSWISSPTYLMEYGPAITMAEIEISTNSWGYSVGPTGCSVYGDYDFDAAEHDHIVNGSAHGTPIAIFFSAGNERNDCDCGMSCVHPFVNYKNIRPPGATSKNTITVGAGFSDASGVADFTSWGPMDDGRLKPEIVVSGDETDSTSSIYAPVPTDTYMDMNGTSMSTPAAAGAGALFWQEFRGLTPGEPLPSTIKAIFVHTAEDLVDGSSYLNVGPDYASGYGSLQVKDAIDVLREGTWLEDSVDHGEVFGTGFLLPGDATWVRVTLAWDDEKGAPGVSPALVNDLELVVLDDLGTRHFPWTLDASSPSDPAVQTLEDHLNPLEQVFVGSSPAPGLWIIDVVGDLVPAGPQPFSLVWSHDGTIGEVAAPEPTVEGSLRVAELHPSHPNPFRPWTTIRYTLERPARVDLRVLDVAGRVVRTLESGAQQGRDSYTYAWRGKNDAGRDLAAGVYLVELRAGQERSVRKVTLMR